MVHPSWPLTTKFFGEALSLLYNMVLKILMGQRVAIRLKTLCLVIKLPSYWCGEISNENWSSSGNHCTPKVFTFGRCSSNRLTFEALSSISISSITSAAFEIYFIGCIPADSHNILRSLCNCKASSCSLKNQYYHPCKLIVSIVSAALGTLILLFSAWFWLTNCAKKGQELTTNTTLLNS